jgi:hypothetical protein
MNLHYSLSYFSLSDFDIFVQSIEIEILSICLFLKMFIFSNRMFNRTENATANKKLLVYLNSVKKIRRARRAEWIKHSILKQNLSEVEFF